MSEVKRATEALPDQLICMTVQMNLTNPDAIEEYLQYAPRATEKCLPMALRDIIFSSYNSRWRSVPDATETQHEMNAALSKIVTPDAQTTQEYLTALWSNGFMSPFDPSQQYITPGDMVFAAAPATDTAEWYDYLLMRGIHDRLPYLVTYALSNGANVNLAPLDVAAKNTAITQAIDSATRDLFLPVAHMLVRAVVTPAHGRAVQVIYILLAAGANINDNGQSAMEIGNLIELWPLSKMIFDELLRIGTPPAFYRQTLIAEALPIFAAKGDLPYVKKVFEIAGGAVGIRRLKNILTVATRENKVDVVRYLLNKPGVNPRMLADVLSRAHVTDYSNAEAMGVMTAWMDQANHPTQSDSRIRV